MCMPDNRTVRTKIALFVFLIAVLLLTVPFSMSAEMSSVEFIMEEEPVFIDEKNTDEILEFYENATREDLLSAETNTFVKRNIQFDDEESEKNVVVHTFRVTDILSLNEDDAVELVSDTIESIFLELTSELGKKYISTLTYMYGAYYEITFDQDTGVVSEMLLHIALVVGDGFDKIDELIENYIRPVADEWREYPQAKQILMLNNFMLDGRFTYDIHEQQRKSTVAFVEEGRGVCEEYAGLTALFLDELGFENILIRGYAQVDGERIPHVWNMVKIEDTWYHLDILWDGPIDANGVHTDITSNYLLKSTNTVKADHLTPAVCYSYADKAVVDYDFSEFMYNGEIITPQTKLDLARETLAEVLDNAFDVLFRNSWKYTEDTVTNITPVYQDAKSVYESEDATIEQLDAETAKLNDALAKYVVVLVQADKTSLYKYLSRAYEYLFYDFALYTAESLKALEDPYGEAELVYQNAYATQSEVNTAKNTLKKYINLLEKIPVEDPDENTDPDGNDTEITPNPDDQTSPDDNNELVDTNQDENKKDPDITENPDDTNNEEIVDPDTQPNIPDEDDSKDPDDSRSDDPTSNDHPSDDPDSNASEDLPITIPEEPDKTGLSNDIYLYIVVAVLALGGIIYLIVSKIRENNADDEEEETEAETVEAAEETETETAESEEAEAETVKSEETEAEAVINKEAEAVVTETSDEKPETVETAEEAEAETVKSEETEAEAVVNEEAEAVVTETSDEKPETVETAEEAEAETVKSEEETVVDEFLENSEADIEEDVSVTEKKNREKISQLMQYFKKKNQKNKNDKESN